MALLILMAAVALPSLGGLKGNADQKVAADQLRARIADARGLAMQEGLPYRLAVHKDGNKIRVAPDTPEFARVPVSDVAGGSVKAIETKIEKATINVVESDTEAEQLDDWITLGTFLANGTCREDSTLIEVIESSFPAIRIHLRGVTGTARVLPMDPGASGGMKP